MIKRSAVQEDTIIINVNTLKIVSKYISKNWCQEFKKEMEKYKIIVGDLTPYLIKGKNI